MHISLAYNGLHALSIQRVLFSTTVFSRLGVNFSSAPFLPDASLAFLLSAFSCGWMEATPRRWNYALRYFEEGYQYGVCSCSDRPYLRWPHNYYQDLLPKGCYEEYPVGKFLVPVHLIYP